MWESKHMSVKKSAAVGGGRAQKCETHARGLWRRRAYGVRNKRRVVGVTAAAWRGTYFHAGGDGVGMGIISAYHHQHQRAARGA